MLNNQGVEVGHVEGRKNPQEQAEQNRRAQELAQRQQHDHFLLATYVSTKDIERLRDERMEQMDGQIKASAAYMDTLGRAPRRLQDRAMHFKPYSSSAERPADARRPGRGAGAHANEARTQRSALEAKRSEAG